MDATLKTELESMFKEFAAAMLPAIDTAAKAAVSATLPVAALIVDPLIDAIDAKVTALLGNPAVPVTAPQDVESRLTAIENHVAALTVATGSGTSQTMQTAKVAVIQPAITAPVQGGN